jgi:hypothetical protein
MRAIDELHSAAREMLRMGEHPGACVSDDDGSCPSHWYHLKRRRERLIAAVDGYELHLAFLAKEER